MAEGTAPRPFDSFVDKTSELSFNNTYIETSYTTYWTNGKINIVSLNFKSKGDIPANTNLIFNLSPTYNGNQFYFSMAPNGGGSPLRGRVHSTGNIQNEDLLSGVHWYNGLAVYLS